MVQSGRPRQNKMSASQTDIDFQLWMLLDHARSAISRARELELAQYGLTPEQAGLLRTLLDNSDSATNVEIADSMIRQYNTITTLVNRAARMGLVRKKKSSKGRKYLVLITPKGKDIYQKVTFNSIRIAFSEFNVSEKQQLTSYLKRTTDKARNMLGMDNRLSFLQ